MPGFTGFGGSWNDGVHSGGDDSGSIGGGSGSQSSALEQFSQLAGVKPSEVSNFRSDGEGGWTGDIGGVGAVHAFADEMGSHTSPTGNAGGSSKQTPWGNMVNDGAGNTSLNGVKLTAENSQLVFDSPNTQVRVLNSILDRSFMTPEPGENSGVTGVPATTPSRLTLADNALINAQQNATSAANALSKANENITQSQTRLDAARAQIPALEANVASRQEASDKATARAHELGHFLNDMGGPGRYQALQAGYQADVALTALSNARKELESGQAEVSSAQKALDDAMAALPGATASKNDADNAVASAADMKDAITTATAFFESVSKKFGERAARLAQELAAQSRSAKIRSVPEAVALFDKYKGTAVNKLNAEDKAAIANAFKSLDQTDMAKQLAAYSKVFGGFNKAMDFADLGVAVGKGIETGNWSDAINKIESIALTNTAGQLAAIGFAAAGAPLGIVGFGIVMMLSGVIFSNENVLSAINTSLGM